MVENNDENNIRSNMSNDSKYKYRVEIQQMMFVLGEVIDLPIETVSVIEDIVRSQVIEIILQSTKTALARGTKSIIPEDIIFLMRDNVEKVNRLRTYLSWKEVRKNAKDHDGTIPDDIIDNNTTQVGVIGVGIGSNNQLSDGSKQLAKHKKCKIKLPWELQFMFTEQHLETNEESERIDDDERFATFESLKRLKLADERTKNMTKEEYVHWSECRQASFTFRKSKRFKEWALIPQLCDLKLNDDVLDILGFLTFEIVCSLTENAIKIKNLQQKNFKHITEKEKNKSIFNDTEKKKKLFHNLVNSSNFLLPYHIQEAWRVLQWTNFKSKSLRSFNGSLVRTRTKLI